MPMEFLQEILAPVRTSVPPHQLSQLHSHPACDGPHLLALEMCHQRRAPELLVILAERDTDPALGVAVLYRFK